MKKFINGITVLNNCFCITLGKFLSLRFAINHPWTHTMYKARGNAVKKNHIYKLYTNSSINSFADLISLSGKK